MNRYIKANRSIRAPEELKERTAAQGKAKRRVWPAAVAAVLALAILCGVMLWPGGSPLPPAAETDAPGNTAAPSGEPAVVHQLAAYEPDYTAQYDGAALDRDSLDAIRAFAAQAANALLAEEDTAAWSPAALYTALSMVAELADGESLNALLDVLGADGVETLRSGTGDLWRYLCTNPEVREPGTLTLANSLWLSEERQYNGETLQNLADYYYVASYTGDMVNEIPDLVSRWVQEQTHGLLDCRPETNIDTAALLLSAIYFYDEWAEPFFERDTTSGSFLTAAGKRVNCDYMKRTEENTAYYRGNGFTAAVQYFQNGSKMLFILPDEGNSPAGVLADTDLLVSLLDWEGLDKGTGTVEWFIPRFTLSSTLDLENGLTALGLGELFDGNLGPLTKLTDVGAYISRAEQGTAISINETGCEAASYVEIDIADSAVLWVEEPVLMHLTRPFVFAVLSDNDVPLFIGTVGDPNG